MTCSSCSTRLAFLICSRINRYSSSKVGSFAEVLKFAWTAVQCCKFHSKLCVVMKGWKLRTREPLKCQYNFLLFLNLTSSLISSFLKTLWKGQSSLNIPWSGNLKKTRNLTCSKSQKSIRTQKIFDYKNAKKANSHWKISFLDDFTTSDNSTRDFLLLTSK